MLAFNTPFFPEVLVASSVPREGGDLHHHDLSGNPSALEQRTGRIELGIWRFRHLQRRGPTPLAGVPIGSRHDESIGNPLVGYFLLRPKAYNLWSFEPTYTTPFTTAGEDHTGPPVA